MNVYDFDQTIYGGDSTVDFYLYCLRRQPSLILCLPRQLGGLVRYATGRIDTTAFKERFFCFLPKLTSPNAWVEEFWEDRQKKIKGWYLENKRGDDVIISASPEFLLSPICKRLGVTQPIATELDVHTGRITGKNCKGAEKVRRFLERYPDDEIGEFYSDSMTDAPLAQLAKEAFLVQKTSQIRDGFERKIARPRQHK